MATGKLALCSSGQSTRLHGGTSGRCTFRILSVKGLNNPGQLSSQSTGKLEKGTESSTVRGFRAKHPDHRAPNFQ